MIAEMPTFKHGEMGIDTLTMITLVVLFFHVFSKRYIYILLYNSPFYNVG